MKIHLLSDLHLECSPFPFDEEAVAQADVIVLAGDICEGAGGLFFAEELLAAAQPHAQVVYVAGNHEHYGQDLPKHLMELARASRRRGRIHFLENQEAVIQGVRFLGSTLWTDFELFGDDEYEVSQALYDAQNGLNDFRIIAHGGRRFTPEDSRVLHRMSVAWLEKKFAEPFKEKTVVVTHHAPHWCGVAKRFQMHPLTVCFASHLDHLMGKSALWLHGHTHDAFDYDIEGTRVVCNPRGYAYGTNSLPENLGFQLGLIIEI